MRRRLAYGLATLMLGLVACTGGGGGGGGDGGGGGPIDTNHQLRIGTNSTVDSLNPFVAFNQNSYTTFEYIYPYLVQYDTRRVAAGETSDDALVPDFATSWETSDDGLDWTFHTRPGATWSDGKPLSARDMAFTMNTILKFKGSSTANTSSLLINVTGAETPDDNTLVVHYRVPVANVLSQLQQLPILPEHVWAPNAKGDGTKLKSFKNDAPIVSGGPFVLQQFKAKDIALFATNPAYYGPKPKMAGFGLEMFRNDDALIQALKNGEIDMIEGGGGFVPPTAVQPLKDAGFTIVTGPGLSENDFIINSNPKKPKNRELLDPAVKEAFERAIDRDTIVETVWQGLAQSTVALIPPADGVWHNKDLQPLAFNVDEANRLLDEAGFAKGPDGIRVAGDHKMAYDVLTPDDLTGVDRSFTIIQGDFAKIGVKLSQRALDSSATFAAITAPGDTGYLHFDLALWNWVPLIDPDFILSVVTCDQFGGWNDSGYCDPTYDQMYQQQGTLVDATARQELVWRMQEKLAQDRPYIMLNVTNVTDAYSKEWTGFVTSPQGSFNPLSKESLQQVHFAG